MNHKELKSDGISLDRIHELPYSLDWSLFRYKTRTFIQYTGTKAPHAEVILSFKDDSLKESEVTDIIPLEKKELSVEEYNQVLDLFYEEVIKPYIEKHSDVKVIGPIEESNPLNHISKSALEKLKDFLQHLDERYSLISPSDEERWFDFICQTVDDNQTFDYDTLYLLLQDDWSEGASVSKDQADKLAREYVDYVRLLQYYRKTRKAD